jgi:hypothetical protein
MRQYLEAWVPMLLLGNERMPRTGIIENPSTVMMDT